MAFVTAQEGHVPSQQVCAFHLSKWNSHAGLDGGCQQYSQYVIPLVSEASQMHSHEAFDWAVSCSPSHGHPLKAQKLFSQHRILQHVQQQCCFADCQVKLAIRSVQHRAYQGGPSLMFQFSWQVPVRASQARLSIPQTSIAVPGKTTHSPLALSLPGTAPDRRRFTCGQSQPPGSNCNPFSDL